MNAETIYPRNRREWARAIARNPLIIRHYRFWIESLQTGRSPLNDARPWITFPAADWLAFRLRSSMSMFEWGSGGSTLFFAQRVGRVFSVEHDREWFARVQAELQTRRLHNVRYSLCEPVIPTDRAPDVKYTSTDQRYKGMDFEAYARAIESHADEAFDLIFVDGRARTGCMHHALPKLRPGGLLVLDNSERAEYDPGRQLVAGWQRWEFPGPGPYGVPFWNTTAWRKPTLGRPS